ncbi:MAG: radical SAM family heme chaperone HemW [Muribaculaceae bacterium]|nr:radical SAM family heme chaperone HemW [Muribaculaceae bacterium]
MNKDRVYSSGGVYVHVPYCRKRCIYCDFYSAGVVQADWHRLVDALLTELDVRKAEWPDTIETLYIGGGTPSLIPVREFERLSTSLHERLINSTIKEFTIEVNPEDVNVESVAVWKANGVNRVSIGIQSFDDRLLRIVGRLHGAETARHALKLLRSEYDNVSGDIIFGLPGQSIRGFERDIREILDMGVTHLSAYSLMYEERTALTRLRDMGRVNETDEADSIEMFSLIGRLTEAYGLRRYELSNYAVPGYESRHNNLYWSGKPYLGLGPSAHSYDGKRTRCWNAGDIRRYLQTFTTVNPSLDLQNMLVTREILTDEELREEQIMTRLRTIAGLDCRAYRLQWGEQAWKKLKYNMARHIESGNLCLKEDMLSLTEKGVMISDEVIVDLF